MQYTPKQIVDYIIDEGLEADFLANMQMHKGDFSIGEIPDKKFVIRDGKCIFKSKMYSINTEISDEDISNAAANKSYISAFVSRKSDDYNVHFLVHKYPEGDKEKYEDEITMEVVRYMITMTVLALRLDNIEKVKAYISK